MYTREDLLKMRSTWPDDIKMAENNRPWLNTVLSHLQAIDEIDQLKTELENEKTRGSVILAEGQIEKRDKVLVEQHAEIDRLNKWVSDLQSHLYINCVYCGHRYAPGTGPAMQQVLYDHIKVCPKHPLAAALKEIERLKEELKNYDEATARDVKYVESIRNIMDERGRDIETLQAKIAELKAAATGEEFAGWAKGHQEFAQMRAAERQADDFEAQQEAKTIKDEGPVTEAERIAVAEQFQDPKNAADDPVIRAAIEKRVAHIGEVLREIDKRHGKWSETQRWLVPAEDEMPCPACADGIHVVHYIRQSHSGTVDGSCNKAGCLNFQGAR